MDARTKRGEPVISYSQPLPPETEQVLRKAKGVNMSTVIVPLRKKRSDDFGALPPFIHKTESLDNLPK
ncbi:hypothetical protein V511_10450 [Mesotoga sp. Brook.08.YT.4.2.5.1]|jgi:hypothetical protein|uniref:hypothetical protein n=1 Tax=unclassified Mesotoga TaxID=1184398 RepID=UPI000C180C18|nr:MULTISPECIES: hypothetical protein [unclassified Mesotoga]PNE20034.1 hypothetical protein V511_10450 [Mesotoga sp. Brook.08.YT.4.2.5.1]PVD16849.1 hypothetical protein V512_007960 [Mesotoga sp. Brook.08.105.5.1]RAO97292.1 hypothetical protein M388_00570 [Mesotoga sp. Brook.08.YT.4.2.5.4.]RDI91565.1 hypothetical protein Q502_11245 [Mesotoga sp. Brook.08.YT.4.2.5.2.]